MILKFASIDIGSNAVRLLLCNVSEYPNTEPVFKKSSLIRVPLRLGMDAFSVGSISEQKVVNLVKTMKAFKELIEVHEVISFRACATSAMREASNAAEIVKRVREEAGISIEVVDGAMEAEIIYANHIEDTLDEKKAYLYIDVGGGSTELTFFVKRKIVASHSFNIGTIRLLKNKVTKDQWQEMKDWVRKVTYSHSEVIGIGSGGNINKLLNMVRKKDQKHVNYNRLMDTYNLLNTYTLADRIRLLGLNPDRADVIVPASEIFLTVMKAGNIEKVMVPQIGLSDGIIHLLYETYKGKKSLVKSEL
jgi:exopolyphosphatase/guanosine-5'-triphosphate,3'-diphosphate pyrophosphatase